MCFDEKQDLVASKGSGARQLVLAGPGTGKTQTVALRLRHLLQDGTGPAQILVLSFSRSAVRTLVRRLETFAGDTGTSPDDLRHISIRTFDSWTFRMLRQLGDVPRDLLNCSYDHNIARLTDMIAGNRREEIQNRLSGIRHVIVDEFQDLSGVRGRLVLALLDLLAPPNTDDVGFTILGDEAQAIYGFAQRNQAELELKGLTTVELIRAIRDRYQADLKETELETNYRAAPGLARLAVILRRILARNTRSGIKLDSIRGILGAIPREENDISPDFAESLPDDSAAVLTRTNGEAIRVWQKIIGRECHGPPINVVLNAGSQPVRVPAWVGATLGPMQGTRVTRSQFGRIYAHFYAGEGSRRAKALAVPDEDAAWKSLVRTTQAGEGAVSIDLAELRKRLEWPDLFPDDDGEAKGILYVMTVHQSKGREFSRVSLLVPQKNRGGAPQAGEEILEEASVIFVAVTRAGKVLRRVAAGNIHPLSSWSFGNGSRKRWGSWQSGRINMEMGIHGDVSATSFIDTRVRGSEDAVDALQELLALNTVDLRGRKVMLCKTEEPGTTGKFVYGIHLQEGKEPCDLLGLTTQRLTFDLLRRLGRNYYLPLKIYNLRITDVVTLGLTGEGGNGLAPRWTTSGLWLGVNIYGTGDFKPYRK